MIRFRRAAAYMQTGRSQSAIDDFTAVLNLKPGFEQALLQRGKLYAREGLLQEAEKDLETYLAQHDEEGIQQSVRTCPLN
jgi:DnaJ family protein C protein 3